MFCSQNSTTFRTKTRLVVPLNKALVSIVKTVTKTFFKVSKLEKPQPFNTILVIFLFTFFFYF